MTVKSFHSNYYHTIVMRLPLNMTSKRTTMITPIDRFPGYLTVTL